MAERVVDIMDGEGKLLRTVQVTLDGTTAAATDADYAAKAMQIAAESDLVPPGEVKSLMALVRDEPGDWPDVPQEALDLAVRDTAYFLWEQDGRPEGRAEEYWYRALEQHLRARAYSTWLQQGKPE